MQKHTITLDGHKIAYFTAGNPTKPLFLFIHGWSSFHGVWNSTIEALQDEFFCVSVDLLGFGESDKPRRADYGIEAQGRRVLAIADALHYDHFHLAGHSMGGQIALCIASILAPERVVKLVDVAGVVAARGGDRLERNFTIAWLNYYFPLVTWTLWLLSRAEWMALHIFGVLFYDVSAMPFDSWTADRNAALQPGCHVGMYRGADAIHQLDLTDHLPEISAPTLALFGSEDKMVPVKDGHLVSQCVPQSQLILIEECGHFPMYEHPDAYLSTLNEFLQGKG